MKFFLFSLCIVFSIVTFSQNSFSKADAKSIIDIFFEGFHQGDTLKMKSVMAEGMVMQTAFTTKDGKNQIVDEQPETFLMAIADRPETQKWEERLLDYRVQIDGNLAHVWTPYEFWFNDTFSHCGANAFTLAKTDDGWKIIHLIDSRRKNGCQK